ncbi:MAG: long-chain fatty acid--CoA ligase [Bacteroidales bacterium]|nr:long-chain fatty acid--CoA ligase [Bacteroidales bacterium]
MFMEITRLFDLLPHRWEQQPERPVFAMKNGEWRNVDINEYIEKSNWVSYALMAMGLKRDDKIAIIASNRPEWNYVDMGSQQIGAILVPLYPTISTEDYHYILDNSDAQCIVLESVETLHRIASVLPLLPKIKNIVLIRPGSDLPRLESCDAALCSFEDFLKEGASHPQPEALEQAKGGIGTHDVATIIYTSGSMGFPKGVMLTHANIITNLNGLKMTPLPYFSRALSFLPLCHIYERMMGYLYQLLCYTIYYPESLATVQADMQVARPHMMTAVPRFIEKVYDGIYRKGHKMRGLKKKIFYDALKLGEEYNIEGNPWWYNLRHAIADKLVYKEIRKAFGDNLKIFVSGGSAVQPRLSRFFNGIGMNIYEGYGLTETAPVVAVHSHMPNGRKSGTVGLPLPGTEVKVLPETNEVVCRGPHVMAGYYKAPELTSQAIDAEGWFHTGDTGYFTDKGQLVLTGRINTVFKTSMGKFVNPDAIEEKFKESPFIQDMIVVGENQKFAAAIILPNFNTLKDWQERHKIYCNTRKQMLANQQTQERFKRVVEKYNQFFGTTEQIKRYTLIDDEWTEANGCLTPTLKIRRANVMARCQQEIDNLYK